MSKTERSIKNMTTEFIGQIISVSIRFAARIIFLRYLNAEYLGLSGLFTNVLMVFSLVDLGVGPAMSFSLYKPLAERNTEQIKSLMALYKKAYILIGSAIVIIGLLFTPFYTLLMDQVPDVPHLTLIYWLFTANSAISYFFSYKRALIICNEKQYISAMYQYSFVVLLNTAQIVGLILTHSYLLYLSLMVVSTLAENICVSRKADRMYPYLREKNVKPIPKDTVIGIKKNIRAMLYHKIGTIAIQATDNLILAKLIGLVTVGLYSNYSLIIGTLDGIIDRVFNSVIANIGNLAAHEDAESRIRLEKAFEGMFFANFWIYGVSSCCLWVLFNPFIALCFGENMVFDGPIVLILVINFYLMGMRKTLLAFRDASGAFYYDRYKPLAESVINIAASIWLGKRMGVAGVFLGTSISTITTVVWVEPYVLYKYVLKKSAWRYAAHYLCYALVAVLTGVLTSCIANLVCANSEVVGFILKMLICAAVPNTVFLICFAKTEKFQYLVGVVDRGAKSILRIKGRM